MDGKLIKLSDGGFGIEVKSIFTRYGGDVLSDGTPSKITHVWKLSTWRITGMGWASEESAIGKDATLRYGRVHVYLGNGVSLDGDLPEGDSTKAISVTEEPFPCPKVRKDMETRWNSSKERWEKYSKVKGWIAA